MDNKINHLQMIQGIINRMASNSFALKGWAVSLVAGVFALASKDSDNKYFLVAYIPSAVFWFLDAFYLRQERLFRALYDKIRMGSGNDDFIMNARDMANDASLTPEKKEKLSYCNSLTSATEIWFYLSLIIASTIVIIYNNLEAAKNKIMGNWYYYCIPFIILALVAVIAHRKALLKKLKKTKSTQEASEEK